MKQRTFRNPAANPNTAYPLISKRMRADAVELRRMVAALERELRDVRKGNGSDSDVSRFAHEITRLAACLRADAVWVEDVADLRMRGGA